MGGQTQVRSLAHSHSRSFMPPHTDTHSLHRDTMSLQESRHRNINFSLPVSLAGASRAFKYTKLLSNGAKTGSDITVHRPCKLPPIPERLVCMFGKESLVQWLPHGISGSNSCLWSFPTPEDQIRRALRWPDCSSGFLTCEKSLFLAYGGHKAALQRRKWFLFSHNRVPIKSKGCKGMLSF